MSCEDFTQYRIFLNTFAYSRDEIWNIKFGSYGIDDSEIVAEAINWTIQYLNEGQCPSSLVTPIVKNVASEIQNKDRKVETKDEFESRSGSYKAFEIKRLVFELLKEYCSNLSDNVELNKILALSNDKNDHTVIYSISSIKNTRRSMEDRYICIDDFHGTYNVQTGHQKVHFYAVFDGHNGHNAACYSASHLPFHIAKDPSYPLNPVEALHKAFILTDHNFVKKNIKSGTTALCALYYPHESKLLIAWVGDSKALLAKKGSIMQLVIPHKPNIKEEAERIIKQGGSIMRWGGTLRVKGLLNLSRALGDVCCKPFVISDPDIKCIELDGEEDFFILASDGLWDHLSDEEAALAVYDYIKTKDENSVANHLSELAKNRGSSDNITIIVVFLKKPSLINKTFNNIKTTSSSITTTTTANTQQIDTVSNLSTIMDMDTFDNRYNNDINLDNTQTLIPNANTELEIKTGPGKDIFQKESLFNDGLNNFVDSSESPSNDTNNPFTTMTTTTTENFDTKITTTSNDIIQDKNNIDLLSSFGNETDDYQHQNNHHQQHNDNIDDILLKQQQQQQNEQHNHHNNMELLNQNQKLLSSSFENDMGPETSVDITDDVMMMTTENSEITDLLEQSSGLSHSKETLPSSDNINNPFDMKNSLQDFVSTGITDDQHNIEEIPIRSPTSPFNNNDDDNDNDNLSSSPIVPIQSSLELQQFDEKHNNDEQQQQLEFCIDENLHTDNSNIPLTIEKNELLEQEKEQQNNLFMENEHDDNVNNVDDNNIIVEKYDDLNDNNDEIGDLTDKFDSMIVHDIQDDTEEELQQQYQQQQQYHQQQQKELIFDDNVKDDREENIIEKENIENNDEQILKQQQQQQQQQNDNIIDDTINEKHFNENNDNCYNYNDEEKFIIDDDNKENDNEFNKENEYLIDDGGDLYKNNDNDNRILETELITSQINEQTSTINTLLVEQEQQEQQQFEDISVKKVYEIDNSIGDNNILNSHEDEEIHNDVNDNQNFINKEEQHEIEDYEKYNLENNEFLEQKHEQLQHDDEQLQHNDEQLQHDDEQLQHHDEQLQHDDEQLQHHDEQLEQKHDELQHHDEQLEQKQTELQQQQQQPEQPEQIIQDQCINNEIHQTIIENHEQQNEQQQESLTDDNKNVSEELEQKTKNILTTGSESCDESEDEWKYMQLKEGEGEKNSLIQQQEEKKKLEESEFKKSNEENLFSLGLSDTIEKEEIIIDKIENKEQEEELLRTIPPQQQSDFVVESITIPEEDHHKLSLSSQEFEVREEFEEEEKYQEQSTDVDNFETNNSVLVFEEKNHSAEKEIAEIQQQQQQDFETTISEDMANRLNPDAKEFIPASPVSSNTSVEQNISMNGSNGEKLDDKITEDEPVEKKSESLKIFPSSVNQHLSNDEIIAQSPRKGAINMENIQIPDEHEFQNEINIRPTESSTDVELETIMEIQEYTENMKLSDNEETNVQEQITVKSINESNLENSIYIENQSSEIETAKTTESNGNITETKNKRNLEEAAAAVGILTAATLAEAATIVIKDGKEPCKDSLKVKPKITVSTTVKDNDVKPKDKSKVPAPQTKKVSKTLTATKKLPTTGAVSKATKTATSTTNTTSTETKTTQISKRPPAQASSVASKRPSATARSQPISARQPASMARTALASRSVPTRSIPTRSVQEMKVTSKPSAISKVKLEKTTTIKKTSTTPIGIATGANSSSPDKTNKPKVGVTAKPLSFVPKTSLTKAPVAKSTTTNSAEANRKKTDVTTKNTQDGNKLTKPTAAKPLSFLKKSSVNPTSTTTTATTSSPLATKSPSANIKPRKTVSSSSANLSKDKSLTTQKVTPIKSTKSALTVDQSDIKTTTNKMNGSATKNK